MCESDREMWNRDYEENEDRVRVPDRYLVEEIARLAPGRALGQNAFDEPDT